MLHFFNLEMMHNKIVSVTRHLAFISLNYSFVIIGFDTEGLLPPVWIGGESEALARLERHLERKAWVASFGRPKMTPQSLLPSQTGLSPYLRFGCLSTRLFYYQLTDLYKKVQDDCNPIVVNCWWRLWCDLVQFSRYIEFIGRYIAVFPYGMIAFASFCSIIIETWKTH